jgi:two-component system sensor histidine kinase/response regulator
MLLTSLLEKKSLGTKLFLAVSYGLVIMLLVGFNAISNIRTLSNETNIIYENYLQCVSHLKEANIHLVRIRENIAQLTQIEAARHNQAKSNITKSTVMLQEEIAVARSSLSSQEDKKLLTNFDTFFNDYLGNIKQAILLSSPNKEKKTTENALERFITDNDFLTTSDTTEELLSTLSHNKEQQAFFISEKLKKMREESEHISLLLMFFGVLITAISGFLVGKSVTEPINRLQTAIEGLAAGNLDVVIPHVEDRNEIGAIARASAVLQTMCRGMETQRWIKDNFATISTDLYQVANFPDFAQKFLSAICPLINAGYGVFYIYTQDELQLLSSYGEHEHSEHKSHVALGEGLVGQCALEKKLIHMTNLPEDYIKIRSSLGESIPKNIVVYPILRVNVLVGVLEIAFFNPFSKSEKLLLSALMPMVAMSMDILDRNLKTQELLRETKHQADRMEIQAAKLEEQAVELEAQQSELKETEEWFRGIIESAPDAMLVIDAEGTIVLCNKRADEIFGYPPGELIWGNVDNLVPNSVRLDHPAMRKLFMEEGGARVMGAKSDLYGVRKDGSLFPIEVGLSKLPSANNQSFVCVSARDITLKKEADIALHNAKKIAEDTTQMKSDFLANMSHEIRTPMNAILGISHLISKTHLTHKQRDYVKKIQGSSQHLLGIINDILDLSKIESGKILIEQVDFKIEKVLNNLVNLISDKAKDKGLSLVFDIDDNLPEYLNGDPLRLGQILINYANNAVKFTEKGEIIITVNVLEETDNELFLHFSVRDTGIGLSSDAIEKLFQSFQQADSSTSRKYGGSGLGLSISKQLVTLMNGDVGVESELGKGSLFWFTARLKKAVKKTRNTLHANSLKGRRVLVVDDNEIARYELENMLSNIGLSVTQVSKGTTALKYIRMAEKVGEPYEIIFLDWYMPEMDGAETAKAIHALNLKSQPHLVMVTAHGREEVLKEMEAAGLEDIFIKPVNASLLFDSVMRLLSDSQDYHIETIEETVDDYDLSSLINELKIIYGSSILVVEDNELNQEVALGLLSDEGFNVDIANDGKEAIYMINNKYYDIVLMDMQMPVMDGVSATIEIRKDPQFIHLPIVAMTANAMPQDKENCKNAGMNDYISKPIDPEELFRALLKWIRPTLKEELKELKNDFSISDSSFINELPIIDGLDTQLGMLRVLGKKTLYVNMLKNYVRGQESVPAALFDALNNNDFEAAKRLAHTAKSVSGNIGAMPLHHIAAHIESMITEQVSLEEINEALVHFEILQTQMIQALTSVLLTPQQEEMTQHWEAQHIESAVNDLNTLLKDDDMAALTFLNEHSALLTLALGREAFTTLANLVRNVDFEQASEFLEQIKQNH